MGARNVFKNGKRQSKEQQTHITNVELFNVVNQFFEDSWNNGTAMERSKEKICGVINEIKELLDKCSGCLSENKYYAALSKRQIHCGAEAIKRVQQGDFSSALYALMDCIDNYGEVYRTERAITPNEYMMYVGIVSVFQIALEERWDNGRSLSEDTYKVSQIKNMQHALRIRIEHEKTDWYRDVDEFCIVVLEEYKELLNKKIEQAEGSNS